MEFVIHFRFGMTLTAVAAGLAFFVNSPRAAAQGCATGDCGPRLASRHVPVSGCGHFGIPIYPRFESRYIKQFCGPTIRPGSCYGYHKTQWRQWNEGCPCWPDAPSTMIIERAPIATPEVPAPAKPAAPPAEMPKTEGHSAVPLPEVPALPVSRY